MTVTWQWCGRVIVTWQWYGSDDSGDCDVAVCGSGASGNWYVKFAFRDP